MILDSMKCVCKNPMKDIAKISQKAKLNFMNINEVIFVAPPCITKN